MFAPNKTIRGLSFEFDSPTFALLSLSVAFGAISLGIIALRLAPIAKQAEIWNGCIETTSTFLSQLPTFAANDIDDLKAMSVNLCNGSTPEQPTNSSSNN